MRLTIANSKIKKRNLVMLNNDTYQRETVSEQPVRQPLIKTKSRQKTKQNKIKTKRTNPPKNKRTKNLKNKQKQQQKANNSIILQAKSALTYMD